MCRRDPPSASSRATRKSCPWSSWAARAKSTGSTPSPMARWTLRGGTPRSRRPARPAFREREAMSLRLPRRQYADLYGPTVGDRVRLADTDILIEVEKDFTVYGDEVKFGGGKVIRDGMGQSARATAREGVLDLVITNALILDHWGIVKAHIGVRGGRMAAIGTAGKPATPPGRPRGTATA